MTMEATTSFPGIIYHNQAGSLKVAGLTLLDRLIVALHRAGVGPIMVVSSAPLPAINRTHGLHIPIHVSAEPPVIAGLTLVTRSNLLVQTADVRETLRQEARMANAEGALLPIGVLPRVDSNWETALNQLSIVRAQGVAAEVTDAGSQAAAEERLWASLNSSADSMVDRWFNRPVGRLLSRLLAHTTLSPNAVSIVSILIGLLAACCFGFGTYGAVVVGALLFQVSAVVDCVDGDLARVLFKESRLGQWLDLVGDQVVHIGVFIGIAVGLIREGSSVAFWLGTSTVIGAVLSFVVILQSMRSPARDRSGSLQKLIDSLSNRDFSVLVLALACFSFLELFLWLSAIGSHLFWLAAAGLRFHASSSRENATTS